MDEVRTILGGSSRGPVAGARALGRSDAAGQVHVTVVLARKQPITAAEVEKHASMRPHERADIPFADTYGASEEAVAAVSALAAKFGLKVTNVDRPRRVAELTGSVADMERAFGTTLHDYAVGEHRFRGRLGPLQVPTETLPHIEAVLGLDNRPVAKPRYRSRAVPQAYYPNELAALYDFPPGDGSGQTIALIELGGNYDADDLAAYFTAAGRAAVPNIRTLSVSPGEPKPYRNNPQDDGEVMLDIVVAGAMAPGAAIVVYFAENTDQGFYQATSLAVHDPATTAVSISWGAPEKKWSHQTMDVWDSLGKSAALLNVPIFVASGDHGCADEEPEDEGYDGQRHVDFPASCPHGVAACGGTRLESAGGAVSAETVWNEGDGWASGGGVSTYFARPDWQTGASAEGEVPLPMRGVPDIAGDADRNTGIHVRVDGVDDVSGGTSAVAPQWAALTAILSQQLGRKAGFFIPLLYRHPEVMNEITAGDNAVFGVSGFSAKPGWDACTGLGSPNGMKLLSLLKGEVPAADPVVADAADGLPAGDSVPRGAASTVGVSAATPSQPFDPAVATLFGRFVRAAYTMYGADANTLTPKPAADFPVGYQLVAWINMRDFILDSTAPVFYGFIAQNILQRNEFILAIRGTSNGVEWWDDANSLLKQPFKTPGCGSVGAGFARIYDTLEVVERPPATAVASAAATAPRSLRAVGGFCQQVSSLVDRHTGLAARAAGLTSSASVSITGHSLGAALATLYVLENAKTRKIHNPMLYTFASPRVGDSTFAAAFDALNLTSWRIANKPDIVPHLPFEFLGFQHVSTEKRIDSAGKVQPSFSCWHSLNTYLNVLDPALPLNAACALATAGAAARITRTASGESVA